MFEEAVMAVLFEEVEAPLKHEIKLTHARTLVIYADGTMGGGEHTGNAESKRRPFKLPPHRESIVLLLRSLAKKQQEKAAYVDSLAATIEKHWHLEP
jgi:hypothetical protein